MIKITWKMESASGTVTHEWALSEADMTRITNLLRSDRPQLSAEDAKKAWMVEEAQRLEDRILNHERDIAAQTARNGVKKLGL